MTLYAIFVTPAPDREVRFPPSMQLLPDAGMDVPDDDLFWARRLRDADVNALCLWDNYWPPADELTDWDDGATDWDNFAAGP